MMLPPDSITLERLYMKVYVEPIGGLCNRMRVIASAYQLIRPRDGKLIVKWTANEELNCPAKALFSLPRGIRMVDVTGGDNSTPRRGLRLGGGLVFWVYRISSWPSTQSTVTVAPVVTAPSSSFLLSIVSTVCWTYRRRGRAPNSGS